MSNDLHEMDALFRSALEENEETPSAAVKESLFANLDKKDAESYKKRFIGWKRAAIILLLLLAGYILVESGIMDYSTEKNSTMKANIPAKKLTPEQEVANTLPGNPTFERKEAETKKLKPADVSVPDKAGEIILPGEKAETNRPANNKLTIQKNIQPDKQAKTGTINPGNAAQIKERIPGETLITANQQPVLSNERIIFPTIDSNTFTGDQDMLISGFKIPVIIDSVLKNNLPKSIDQKRIHHFKPYWTLTGLVTYDRVNYKLDSDQPNAITNIKHREVREPSFSFGILATRQLKERWGLQTGIVYSHTAIGISPQKMYAFQDPAGDISYKYITSSGYAYFKPGIGAPPAFGDSIYTTEAKHTLHSLGIPVTVKYAIGKNKLLFIPGAGFEANFITKAKLEIEIEDASNRETVFINKLKGTKSFYWSLVADAELRYIVNKQLSFSIRPVFRYAISPITENNVVETFPYSFGAGLGITYIFPLTL